MVRFNACTPDQAISSISALVLELSSPSHSSFCKRVDVNCLGLRRLFLCLLLKRFHVLQPQLPKERLIARDIGLPNLLILTDVATAVLRLYRSHRLVVFLIELFLCLVQCFEVYITTVIAIIVTLVIAGCFSLASCLVLKALFCRLFLLFCALTSGALWVRPRLIYMER